MSKGKNLAVSLGIPGMVSSRNRSDWSFIYNTSLVKDPEWNVGDSVTLPNGKGFVYCKSGGACYTGQGNAIENAVPATGVDYALLAAAAAIGAMSVKMTAVLTHTVDDLRGGNILLKTVSASDNTALQLRGIIGNDAASPAGTMTIYLDAPLTGALTTLSYGYCMPSPYSDVRLAISNGTKAIVGPAATYVSAAATYFWCQFKGRVMGVACQDAVGKTNWSREVVWKHDGSLQNRAVGDTITIAGENGQVAGYVMDNNSAGNGATEIMLTGHV